MSASESIRAIAIQSTQPCAPCSKSEIGPRAHPLPRAAGPRRDHARTAPSSRESAERCPMIIPCPTRARDGRRVHRHLVAAGKPIHDATCSVGSLEGSARVAAAAMPKEAANETPRPARVHRPSTIGWRCGLRRRRLVGEPRRRRRRAADRSASLSLFPRERQLLDKDRLTAERHGKEDAKVCQRCRPAELLSEGEFDGGSRRRSAGMIPMKPPASGSVAVATPTVCSTTFSRGPKRGAEEPHARKMPKPTSAHWIEPIVTQPVWSPKYMLVKHSIVPTKRPASTARRVSCGPAGSRP